MTSNCNGFTHQVNLTFISFALKKKTNWAQNFVQNPLGYPGLEFPTFSNRGWRTDMVNRIGIPYYV